MAKILECPHCGGQRLLFNIKMQYLQHYTIDDGKLYKTSESSASRTDGIWIRCIECSQKEEFERDGGEWKASRKQVKLIKDMSWEPHSADVSKQMDKDLNG